LAVDGTDGMPNLSPWSPVTIASFVTTFGGVGMVLDELGLPGLLSFPTAAICGAVIAAAVFYLFYRIFSVTQSSSGVSARQAIGRPAEVITPIPHNGTGEIAYVLGGRRFNAPARTEDGHPIPARASVVIVRKLGGAFHVRESVAEPVEGPPRQGSSLGRAG
jgi:membrane protein implicated in regulation of membrane protease activity